MSTHTPGPWMMRIQADKTPAYDYNRHLTVMDSRGFYIASVHADADERQNVSGEEQSLNARLIAAAPDLLEIMKIVYSHVSPALQPRIYTMMEQAIAKAEGRA